ncbi:MAG: LytR C-terminal domain-containing protein [Candidatus Levybacteria bacterium]|nr:LytR C-terminal domain-containing protein [Candidatus Levybacteria bacterium]
MRKKKHLRKKNNTKVAIIFVGFVVFIIAISLVSKLILIVRQSQFDDRQRFTMTVSDSKSTRVFSFSPMSRSMSILKLNESLDSKTLSKSLAIPVDAFVLEKSLEIDQKLDSILLKMILNYSKLQTNLTILDILKLFAFAKQLPESGIYERTISQDLSKDRVDNIVGELFKDELIAKDRKTIQIINATDVAGLGNRLARLITNMGGDVILVATGNDLKRSSIISYVDEKGYTVERLSKILNFKTAKISDGTIADITIMIGEDNIESLPF